MIRPTNNNVIIKPITQTMTPGGIVLPGGWGGDLGTATVVAVGPGIYSDRGDKIDIDLGRGDQVLFMNGHSFELIIEGEKHLLVDANVIVGVID
jgi:co-chaperonin GroES (HSP10)